MTMPRLKPETVVLVLAVLGLLAMALIARWMGR